jgi:hypothetical protein
LFSISIPFLLIYNLFLSLKSFSKNPTLSSNTHFLFLTSVPRSISPTSNITPNSLIPISISILNSSHFSLSSHFSPLTHSNLSNPSLITLSPPLFISTPISIYPPSLIKLPSLHSNPISPHSLLKYSSPNPFSFSINHLSPIPKPNISLSKPLLFHLIILPKIPTPPYLPPLPPILFSIYPLLIFPFSPIPH